MAERAISDPDIFRACIDGDADAVRLLLARDPALANRRAEFLGTTPLVLASHRGHGDVVELLLAAGAAVDAREEASHTTALHWAAEAGHPRVAEILITQGADVAVTDAWFRLGPVGWATLVDWAPAFRDDRAATAELLLSSGARLDPFSAILRGDPTALRTMVKSDRSVLDERLGFVEQGRTPLHFAVSRSEVAMVRLLIELGADLTSLTAWGVSALAIAIQTGHQGIAEILRHAGAVPDISAELFQEHTERAAQLPLSEPGRYLVHACAAAGLSASVAHLLDRGVAPDLEVPQLLGETPSTVTPLHLAAIGGHLGVARCLLDRGAPVDARARATRQTPLHCAAAFGRTEVARLLLERGAAPNARDSEYKSTPAGWAKHSGHRELALLLQDALNSAQGRVG